MSFYHEIDTSFLDDFDVKAFERELEIDELIFDLRVEGSSGHSKTADSLTVLFLPPRRLERI
jgi:hypothetical protein